MGMIDRTRGSARCSLALLCGLALLLGAVRPAWAHKMPSGTSYEVSLSGRVVRYTLSGYEPDLDPIYRVIIATTIRDRRAVLPDRGLILSLYLENFQPGTTPLLPDLTNPNQTATALAGFMQGKAALVSGPNRVYYQGVALAEVFLDNTVHIIVNLHTTASRAAAPLRLLGTLTLHKDLTLSGALHATHDLTAADIALLRAPRSGPVSWQAVIGRLAVPFPRQVGTAGNGASSSGTAGSQFYRSALTPIAQSIAAPPSAASAPPQTQMPLGAIIVGIVAVLLAIYAAIVLWRRRVTIVPRRAAPH